MLLSDGENTSGPDAEAVAQLASTAGVHIFPIGIGSTDGTVLQIDGFSVATALDEQIAEADRLGHQRHVLQRDRFGDADADLSEHRPADRHRPEADRGHRVVRRCQHPPLAGRRQSCRWCGSEGWL